jgi:sec-independent protein translocase protein TatC
VTAYTDRELSLIEHLTELRTRLTWAVLALLVATVASMLFAEQLLKLLMIPLGDSILQAIKPTESVYVYFRIALIMGVTIAMPVIVYEAVLFILPGLLPHERKYLTFMVPGAGISFAAGVVFATFVVMPGMTNFMQGFLSDIVEANWTIENYINFVTFVMFWMGILFEMPLVIFFLAKLGVVTVEQLTKARRWAVIGSALLAAVITPTPDPVNMLILTVPLILLYELGVILARFARPKTVNEADKLFA